MQTRKPLAVPTDRQPPSWLNCTECSASDSSGSDPRACRGGEGGRGWDEEVAWEGAPPPPLLLPWTSSFSFSFSFSSSCSFSCSFSCSCSGMVLASNALPRRAGGGPGCGWWPMEGLVWGWWLCVLLGGAGDARPDRAKFVRWWCEVRERGYRVMGLRWATLTPPSATQC